MSKTRAALRAALSLVIYGEKMSALAKLIVQKEQLLARLEADPAPNEPAEIQALLAKIETALKLLEPQGAPLASGE
ncbi:hypothetical protein ABIF64_000124 [Bradyrhizobium japonicum]|uniref:Uncharacterized protein n=1 Tax=Bradyrhizobium japonicum TaxID=375 RepID=A0ABV2RL77_BRAJP